MFGNRKLRRFQQVEFSVIKLTDNKYCNYKAIHITGPNLSILCYNYDNHYLSNNLKTKQYVADDDKVVEQEEQERYQGVVTNIIKNNKYEITPNLYGYRVIIGDGVEFRSVGNKSFKIGDAVEYHIDYQTQKPFHITAQGGYPFVCEYSNSDYSKYLRNKFRLTTFRKHFISYDYDDDNNNQHNYTQGFIASFNQQTNVGTIEIISTNHNIRYKQILFHLKDSDSLKNLNSIKNQKVEFEFAKIETISSEKNVEFVPFISRNYLDLKKKAINVKLRDNKMNQSIIYGQNNAVNAPTPPPRNKHHKLKKINKLLSYNC